MLISDDDVVKHVASALRDANSIVGPEKAKKLINFITSSDSAKLFINALVLEVAMASIQKGLDLADKQQSILTMPEGIPILVRDSKQKALIVTIPKGGKFYMVGTSTEIDIKPDHWYDVSLFGGQENTDDNKAHIQDV